MKKPGLDPADIKYIVIRHAHGDHDGGVKILQDTHHPHVILAPKDWEPAAREAAPYTHDMDAADGQKLTLGDTTITINITPGHTGGTLSFLVPVKDHGVAHMATEWRGRALSANTSKEMLQSCISNPARFQKVADNTGADVIIGNHTEYNDALTRPGRPKSARQANRTRGWSAKRKSASMSPSRRNAPSAGSPSTTAAPEWNRIVLRRNSNV